MNRANGPVSLCLCVPVSGRWPFLNDQGGIDMNRKKRDARRRRPVAWQKLYAQIQMKADSFPNPILLGARVRWSKRELLDFLAGGRSLDPPRPIS